MLQILDVEITMRHREAIVMGRLLRIMAARDIGRRLEDHPLEDATMVELRVWT